jgi:hypothetical protein
MFTIKFELPPDLGGVMYAGQHKDALGFAPTLESALLWPDRETAERFLANGYGERGRHWGEVVEVPA